MEACYKKAQDFTQSTDMQRLSINSQIAPIGSSQVPLSDSIKPDIDITDDPAVPTSAIPIVQTTASKKAIDKTFNTFKKAAHRKSFLQLL